MMQKYSRTDPLPPPPNFRENKQTDPTLLSCQTPVTFITAAQLTVHVRNLPSHTVYETSEEFSI